MVMKKVYEQIGINAEIKKYPAKRALAQSNNGKVDGEVARIARVAKNYPN